MKFVFIRNNLVYKKVDTDEETARQESGHFQQIICVDGMNPEPDVDWVFDKGILYRDIPSVTPRQIRQALILSGISMSMIDDALSALPEPVSSLAKAEWEYSISFDRRRQLVQQVGILLGWTPEQLDNLWIFAGSIK